MISMFRRRWPRCPMALRRPSPRDQTASVGACSKIDLSCRLQTDGRAKTGYIHCEQIIIGNLCAVERARAARNFPCLPHSPRRQAQAYENRAATKEENERSSGAAAEFEDANFRFTEQ